MSRCFPRKQVKYFIYIAVLLLCIAGLYWRFWYHPQVEPVVMLDVSGLTSMGQAGPSPLLDPSFTWSLVEIDLSAPSAYFQKDGVGTIEVKKVDETIQGWRIKSIEKTMVVLVNETGEERALFFSAKNLKD
jgi:hypothetical protein